MNTGGRLGDPSARKTALVSLSLTIPRHGPESWFLAFVRMAESSPDPVQTWALLRFEILHSTLSLLYLLEGMERVRDRVEKPYSQHDGESRQWVAYPPSPSFVDVALVENGPGVDLNRVWGRAGDAEQLVFRGWVVDIYNRVWDKNLRDGLQESLPGTDVIPPESDVLGDLRRIRNDLVHHGGVATSDNSGRCAVLKWFHPDEQMVLTMRHVLDFLNQMGMMDRSGGYKPHGPAIRLGVAPSTREQLERRPTPEVVSIRTVFDKANDDGTSIHGMSIVFANGVWRNILHEHPSDGTSIKTRVENYDKTRIDENGNVRLADGSVFDRRDLYLSGIAALFGEHPPGHVRSLPSPAIRFRR